MDHARPDTSLVLCGHCGPHPLLTYRSNPSGLIGQLQNLPTSGPTESHLARSLWCPTCQLWQTGHSYGTRPALLTCRSLAIWRCAAACESCRILMQLVVANGSSQSISLARRLIVLVVLIVCSKVRLCQSAYGNSTRDTEARIVRAL